MNLQIITPEKQLLTEQITSISCPTTEGQITILPGHIPLVTNLTSGELIVKSGDNEHYLHVAGGFVEVQKNNQIVILADGAEHFYEIDIARAEEAKKQAEEMMKQQTLADEEFALAAWALQKNLSRINIALKHAHRRTRSITSEGVFKP
jgi:F-type H+-transporting ATPase subunit epsilon